MGRSIPATLLFTLGYALALELLLWAAIEFFPNFEENLPALKQMAAIQALQGILDVIEEYGVGAYVVAQQFFKACNTLGTAAAVLFAAGAVAGEVHRGTLEIWLARPLSRDRILIERFVLGALAVTVPVFLTSATIPWLCERIGEEVFLEPMLLCSVHQSAFLLAIYAFTFFLSTVGKNPTRIALGLLILLVFEFATYMIEKVTRYSIYRWTDVEDFLLILDEGRLDWPLVGSLVGFSGVCLVASVLSFRRRVP